MADTTTSSTSQPMPYETPTTTGRATPAWLIAVAWLFVGLPAAWGVSQTVIKSLDLFRGPPATSAPAMQPPK